jgi:hypothetical protein
MHPDDPRAAVLLARERVDRAAHRAHVDEHGADPRQRGERRKHRRQRRGDDHGIGRHERIEPVDHRDAAGAGRLPCRPFDVEATDVVPGPQRQRERTADEAEPRDADAHG